MTMRNQTIGINNDSNVIERIEKLSWELARSTTLTEVTLASRRYTTMEEFRAYLEGLLTDLVSNSIRRSYSADKTGKITFDDEKEGEESK